MKPILLSKLFLTFLFLLLTQLTAAQEDPRDSIFHSEVLDLTSKEHHEYLNQQYAINPKDWWVNYRYFRYFTASGDLETGLKFLDSALIYNPESSICLSWKSGFLIDSGKLTEAKTLLDKAESIDPGEYWVYIHLGHYYSARKNFGMAKIKYNEAVKLEPKSSYAHLLIASVNLQQNYEVAALKELDEAISIDSNVAMYYYERGKVYYGLNLVSEATNDLHKAYTLDSNNISYIVGYGAALYRVNKTEEALRVTDRALEIDSNDFQAYLNRSMYTYSLERMDDYCEDIRNALRKLPKELEAQHLEELTHSLKYSCDPKRASYYYQRGIASYNLKDYKKALNWYDIGLQKFPDHAITLSFVGNAHMALAEYEEALLAYHRFNQLSLQVREEYIESGRVIQNQDASDVAMDYQLTTYYSMVECYIYLNKLDSAKIYIDKIGPFEYLMNNLHPGLLFELKGKYSMYSGKYTDAIKFYNQAYLISDGNPEYLLNKAIARLYSMDNQKLILVKMGMNTKSTPYSFIQIPSEVKSNKNELKSALEDCNKVLEIAPGYSTALFTRAQIKRLLGDSSYCEDLVQARKEIKTLNLSEYGCQYK